MIPLSEYFESSKDYTLSQLHIVIKDRVIEIKGSFTTGIIVKGSFASYYYSSWDVILKEWIENLNPNIKVFIHVE